MKRTANLKLNLRRESLRRLDGADLEHAAGGETSNTTGACPSTNGSQQCTQGCPPPDDRGWAINPGLRLLAPLPDFGRIMGRSRGL